MISMTWFKVITHDYMDEFPKVSYRQFKDDEEANAYAKHMNEHYSGGTTRLGGYATQQEILDYCSKYNIPLEGKLKEDVMNSLNYKK